MDDVAFITKDADIVNGRVFFSDGKDFSFVRCDSDGSSKGGHRYEHVLVNEAIKPLSKRILGEFIHFVFEFSLVKLDPIVIHKILLINIRCSKGYLEFIIHTMIFSEDSV